MVSEVAGIFIVVQSSTYSTHYVEKRIQLFLEHFYEDILKAISQDELKSYLHALKIEKMEPAKRLSQQAAWYWSEINCHSYYYTRYYDEASCLDHISKNDLLCYFHRYFLGPEQRRLNVHLQSNKARQENVTYRTVFTDATAFKRTHFIYPLKALK